MGISELCFIGLGLSMDCFAVAISGSMAGEKLSLQKELKIAAFFGFFQGGMPILGWLLGFHFRDMIRSYDHWISFIILTLIGGKMMYEALRNKGEESRFDLYKLKILLGLSIATSIDALIIGLSLAFLDVNILGAASIFTLITFAVSMVGLYVGKHSHKLLLGNKAEIMGGAVLIILAFKVLNEHLSFIPILWP